MQAMLEGKIKDKKLKIKIAELPLCGNDFLYFTFCNLIFAFSLGVL
jgi:hypothetical protein